MNRRRTKSVGTKVTPEEYARLEAQTEGQRLGEWVRDALLRAAPPPLEVVLLAEVLALRGILLNLHFALASGDPLTAESMHRLIEHADRDKLRRAHECLASSIERTEP
jgi:hypothetical protein